MSKLYLKQLRYQAPTEKNLSFPFDLPFLEQLNELVFKHPVTFIIGENGTGKSTLIEALAAQMGLNSEGGSKHNLFASYQEENSLAECIRLIRYPEYPRDHYFYRAETYYNLMTNLTDLKIDQELFAKKIHHYSRGESLKELIQQRFFGHGFYLMDEPETGLSLPSQLELIVMIADLVKKESQFIIATHSPVLLLFPQAQIIELSQGGLRQVSRQETKLYQDWQMLFQRQEHFIAQLLQEN